jgi:hypothetical protein
MVPAASDFRSTAGLAALRETVAMDDNGLDQCGTHSLVISPCNVLSESNYVPGSDTDELRNYNRRLGDEHMAELSAGERLGRTNLALSGGRSGGETTYRAQILNTSASLDASKWFCFDRVQTKHADVGWIPTGPRRPFTCATHRMALRPPVECNRRWWLSPESA